MGGTWITHFPDFLDDMGRIAKAAPLQTRQLGAALGFFIIYATNHDDEKDEKPQCFVGLPDRRCLGIVTPFISMEDAAVIVWRCGTCGRRGMITGWRNTVWDLSR